MGQGLGLLGLLGSSNIVPPPASATSQPAFYSPPQTRQSSFQPQQYPTPFQYGYNMLSRMGGGFNPFGGFSPFSSMGGKGGFNPFGGYYTPPMYGNPYSRPFEQNFLPEDQNFQPPVANAPTADVVAPQPPSIAPPFTPTPLPPSIAPPFRPPSSSSPPFLGDISLEPTPQVIVYGPDGTQYPNPAAARAAGVNNYSMTNPVNNGGQRFIGQGPAGRGVFTPIDAEGKPMGPGIREGNPMGPGVGERDYGFGRMPIGPTSIGGKGGLPVGGPILFNKGGEIK